MLWFWEHILFPIVKHTWYLFKIVFKWAYNNPVASMIIGGTLLAASVIFWLADEDVYSALAATWGFGLLLTGAIGYVAQIDVWDFWRWWITPLIKVGTV
jgi:hypothetical protein